MENAIGVVKPITKQELRNFIKRDLDYAVYTMNEYGDTYPKDSLIAIRDACFKLNNLL